MTRNEELCELPEKLDEEEEFDVCIIVDGEETVVGKVAGSTREEVMRRGLALAQFMAEELYDIEEDSEEGGEKEGRTVN